VFVSFRFLVMSYEQLDHDSLHGLTAEQRFQLHMLKLSTQRDVANLQLAESIKTMTDAQLLAYRGRDSVSLEWQVTFDQK
jgi:hypothetical protein